MNILLLSGVYIYREYKMNNDHKFLVNNMLIFGNLFFFTIDSIKEQTSIPKDIISDLYKEICYN